ARDPGADRRLARARPLRAGALRNSGREHLRPQLDRLQRLALLRGLRAGNARPQTELRADRRFRPRMTRIAGWSSPNTALFARRASKKPLGYDPFCPREIFKFTRNLCRHCSIGPARGSVI